MRIKSKHRGSATGRSNRKSRHAVESLERRALLAAHIAGNPVIYQTIQAAVDAAAPNSVITVDPGVYPELVGIDEPLTIRGANWGIDPRGGARQDSSKETIVTGESVGSAISSGFYIAASDVTIDGFTVQGNTSPGMYGAGIAIAPNRSGTHVLNNIIQNNIAGLFLANASATDAAVIQHNIFRSNNNPGAESGRGIYTDGSVSGGTLQNVTIDGNFFFNNYGGAGSTGLEAAIGLEAVSTVQTNIRITNNVMEGNGKALLAFNASNLTITGNVATTIRDVWSGTFRFEGGISNVSIQNNTVYNNGAPAVRVDAKSTNTLSSGFVITDNNFYSNGTGFENPNASVVVNAEAYSGTLDVRSNWWGSSGGPSGDESGTGDGLYVNGAIVQFAPWSATPVTARETPFDGLPSPIGVLIQAENFDQGGAGVAYLTGRTKNAGGAYRTSGVGISNAADVDQGYKIGFTTAGQWYAYTVNVTHAGFYRIDYRLGSSQTVGGKFHFEVDDVNVTGTLTAPNTGSYTTYQTLSSANFSLSAGAHVLKLVLDTLGNGGAVADFNWMQITPAAMPVIPNSLSLSAASASELDLSWAINDPSVTSLRILRRTDGGPFEQIATVDGGTHSFADTGLSTNVTYGYEVVAVNDSGSSLSAGPISATTPTAPGSPTNFTVSSATTTSIALTWTAAPGATGYQLYRSSSSDAATLVATLTSGATSYIDGGLKAGEIYEYSLTPSNISGTGGTASIDGATNCMAPTSPAATALIGQIALTWTSVAGATSYNIYRGTTPGGESTTPIAMGVFGTGYIDPGLSPGTTYYYTVRAVNSAGVSAASTETSANSPDLPPLAPALSVAIDAAQITLRWSGGANAQSYNIYRATRAGGETSGLLASDVTSRSYTDTTALAGETYYYVVTAANSLGESSFSNEVQALVTVSLLPAPTGLAAVASETRTILSWNAVDGATSYLLYRGTSAGGESTTPIAVDGNTYLDADIAPGSTYFYQVMAHNAFGASALSAEVSASVPTALPFTPGVTGKLPATIIAGQSKPFSQTVTVINPTKLTLSETLTTHWFLSKTSTIDTSAVSLPGVARTLVRLKPGARLAIPARFAGIPKSLAAGNYFLIARITDATGAACVAASPKAIAIVEPTVALRAILSGVPRSVTAGSAAGISLRVTNSGNVFGGGALPVTVSITDINGQVVQGLSFKPTIHIAAGASEVVRLTFRLSPGLPSQIVMKTVVWPGGVITNASADAIALTTPAITLVTRNAKR